MGPDPPTATYRHVIDVARLQNVQVVHHVAGDTFAFGSTTVTVMAPAADYQLSAEPKNNDSLVLRVDWGKTSALLAGDVEKKQEHFLAGENVRADLLKVAHHGSATSTTPEFLDAVLANGVDIVQLREKNLEAADELALLEVFAEPRGQVAHAEAVVDAHPRQQPQADQGPAGLQEPTCRVRVQVRRVASQRLVVAIQRRH